MDEPVCVRYQHHTRVSRTTVNANNHKFNLFALPLSTLTASLNCSKLQTIVISRRLHNNKHLDETHKHLRKSHTHSNLTHFHASNVFNDNWMIYNCQRWHTSLALLSLVTLVYGKYEHQFEAVKSHRCTFHILRKLYCTEVITF